MTIKDIKQSSILQILLDHAMDGIISIRSSGEIFVFNKAAEQIFGYLAKEIIGKNINILMPEPFSSKHHLYIKNYLKTGKSHIMGTLREVSGLRKDGSEFPMELIVSEITMEGESLFLGMIRDITARKQLEYTLQHHRALLEHLNNLPSQLIPEGKPHLTFNPLLESLLHLTESEYGFIGELLDPNAGSLHFNVLAGKNITWNEEAGQFYQNNTPFPVLHTLFNQVFTHREPLIVNDSVNLRSSGLLHNFLGFPFKVGNKMVGMMGLVNRPGGYTQTLLDFLTPLLTIASHLINFLEYSRQKSSIEGTLGEISKKLHQAILEVNHYHRDHTILSEFDEMLQTCYSHEEIYHVVTHIGKKLFPELTSALYIHNTTNKYLTLIQQCGQEPLSISFNDVECIAMRRGRPHLSAGEDSALNCLHIDPKKQISLCVPMIAQNNFLGIFQIVQARSQNIEESVGSKQDIALTLTHRIALSLANIRLAESLREQSVRDPLTGLFNKRYMEETFSRELSRAKRIGSTQISMALLDIDHFKEFNDTYGHDVGDTLLIFIAKLLTQYSRRSDVACRLGREEFLLILPDCPLQTAYERIEQLRSLLEHSVCEQIGKPIGTVTFSAGMAAYPNHGHNLDTLIQTASKALYQAKENGRNCIIIAEEPPSGSFQK